MGFGIKNIGIMRFTTAIIQGKKHRFLQFHYPMLEIFFYY